MRYRVARAKVHVTFLGKVIVSSRVRRRRKEADSRFSLGSAKRYSVNQDFLFENAAATFS